MPYIRVTSADLELGSARQVIVPAEPSDLVLAVVRDQTGRWHAIDDTCTHADVSLSEGDVDEDTIECRGHCAKFNLTTGEGELPAPEPVNVYPVIIEGADVLVSIE